MAAPLHSLVDAQAALVRAASLALPGQFTQCTYDLGYLKQAVHLCLTCDTPRGICSACSIACHGDHEQIELFPKRHFRCDCPTSSLAHPCTLKTPVQPPNPENRYGQNFTRGGVFCRCATPYDVKLERETMVQCLACQDWFHESCLNLRDRVPPRQPTDPETAPPPEPPAEAARPDAGSVHEPVEADDAGSDRTSVCSDNDLPSALLPGESYDALVCGACVAANPTLRRYAGTPGVRMVVPAGEGFVVLGSELEPENGDGTGGEGEQVDVAADSNDLALGVGSKRRAVDDHDVSPPTKRLRPSPTPDDRPASSSTCLAPPINPQAQAIFDSLGDGKAHGDVFLSAGWRGRWCRYALQCNPPLVASPWLLEDEETYEPPQDPDAHLSLEELGMRALSTLPHERALDSIRAYNSMRDDLMLYLRPFAETGQVVREEDITAFFERRRGRQSN